MRIENTESKLETRNQRALTVRFLEKRKLKRGNKDQKNIEKANKIESSF